MQFLTDEKLYAQCIAEVQKLPQADYLTPENVDLWLDSMYKTDPERIQWHIKRLNGFGGSEMGHLVADDFDEFDMFGSARETVASKLMLKLPDPPSGDTERGTFMEPTIQKIFLEKFKAKSLTDVMDKMGEFRSEEHPWLVGNTDDYVQLVNGKKYLVDYKCPRPGFKDYYDKHGVKFDYIVQLHHYALILKAMGEQVDGLLLCSFDVVDWDIDVRVVDINPDMYDSILKNGDNYWFDNVMAASLPDWKKSGDKVQVMDSSLSEEDRERITVLSAELTALLPLASASKSKADNIKAEITEILDDAYMGVPKLTSGVIDIGISNKFDSEKIEEEAATIPGFDINEYKVPAGKNLEKAWGALEAIQIARKKDMSAFTDQAIDYKAVAEDLLARGIPEYRLSTESFRIGLSRSKSPAVIRIVDGVKSVSDSTMDAHDKAIKALTGDDTLIEASPLVVPEPKEKPATKSRKPKPTM